MENPSLWACLIREIAPQEQPLEECLALVSTRRFADGYAALQAYRPRWHIENDGYRELKEGFGLEEQRRGRDAATAQCRTALTILAFNTTQVYRSRGGSRLAKLGIRRLRRQTQPELGRSPAAVFMEDCYGVMSLEALLAAVGAGVRQGLLPDRASCRSRYPAEGRGSGCPASLIHYLQLSGPAGLFLTRSSRGLYIEVGTCEPFCCQRSFGDRNRYCASPLRRGVDS